MSERKEECSDVGVEFGVFGDANTSNWRERYAREFIRPYGAWPQVGQEVVAEEQQLKFTIKIKLSI